MGGGGPADVVENYASRFGAGDPRVPQCGGAALRRSVWPQGLPQGATTLQRARSVPRPFTLPGPPTCSPSSSSERLSADGRGGVRGFTTEMKADPWRAVRQRAETWVWGLRGRRGTLRDKVIPRRRCSGQRSGLPHSLPALLAAINNNTPPTHTYTVPPGQLPQSQR